MVLKDTLTRCLSLYFLHLNYNFILVSDFFYAQKCCRIDNQKSAIIVEIMLQNKRNLHWVNLLVLTL